MAVLGPISLGLGLGAAGSAAGGAAEKALGINTGGGGIPGRAWTVDAEGNLVPMFDAPLDEHHKPGGEDPGID